MSNTVWTTKTMREDNLRMFGLSFPNKFDYTTYCYLKTIENKTPEQEEERRKNLIVRIELSKTIDNFKKLNPEFIPKILYAHNVIKDIEVPHFMRTWSGDVIITEECAQILKQFKLGTTEMHPVSFFDLDLNEPVNNKTYYFLNICEWRHFLVPEQCSKDMRTKTYKNDNYDAHELYEPDYRNNAIAISDMAINCDIDLWHDPALNHSVFMSDALKQALEAAGMTPDWRLFTCLLVQHS